MKKIYTTIFLALYLITANAQAPNWLWATDGGGTVSDIGYSTAVDASGNSYVTGTFSSASMTIGTTTLTNTGGQDIFIAKYDNNGSPVWAKRFGGTGNDVGYTIVVDATGNLYVTGFFASPSIVFNTTTLTNAGGNDIFVAKFDNLGNAIWADQTGTTGADVGWGLSVDAAGNCYVTGEFTSTGITFGTITILGSGFSDIFIAKYSTAGTVLWAKSVGGTDLDVSYCMAIDGSANIYITGYFKSPTITFGTTTLTNASGSFDDIFIAKYDSAGTFQLARREGGTLNDQGWAIGTNSTGNFAVTGYFNSANITIGTTTLTNGGSGSADVFISQYNTSGVPQWAARTGGTAGDVGSGIAMDASGNTYVTGWFASASIIVGSTTLTNTNTSDEIYVAKYNNTGTSLWAKSAGGPGLDYGYAITVDASANAYVTGYYGSTTLVLGTTTLTNAGPLDFFVAKLDNTSGIEDPADQSNISVYPNPSTGMVTIAIEGKADLILYNTLGEKILEQTLDSDKTEIDLSKHTKGIYFAEVISEKGRITKKLIIQ